MNLCTLSPRMRAMQTAVVWRKNCNAFKWLGCKDPLLSNFLLAGKVQKKELRSMKKGGRNDPISLQIDTPNVSRLFLQKPLKALNPQKTFLNFFAIRTVILLIRRIDQRTQITERSLFASFLHGRMTQILTLEEEFYQYPSRSF